MNNLDYLVNHALPTAAKQHNWPIRFNHCFRRVIYDNIVQGKWNDIVPTPGKDYLDDQECCSLALLYLQHPNILIEHNNISLSYRK